MKTFSPKRLHLWNKTPFKQKKSEILKPQNVNFILESLENLFILNEINPHEASLSTYTDFFPSEKIQTWTEKYFFGSISRNVVHLRCFQQTHLFSRWPAKGCGSRPTPEGLISSHGGCQNWKIFPGVTAEICVREGAGRTGLSSTYFRSILVENHFILWNHLSLSWKKRCNSASKTHLNVSRKKEKKFFVFFLRKRCVFFWMKMDGNITSTQFCRHHHKKICCRLLFC